MEGLYEAIGKRDDQSSMIKKRRTKRPRHHETSSSSPSLSSSFGDSSGGGGGGFDHLSRISNDSNIESSQRVEEKEEEEDMAKCLMLLSQGHIKKLKPPLLPPPSPPLPSCNSKQSPTKESYECKTCNRVFPSFQALGGHRASHRKPKEQGSSPQRCYDTPGCSVSFPPRNITNKMSTRIHECSICGAEFSSGQALGGHMRRHRPLPVTAAAATNNSEQEIKKPMGQHPLALDLNLPAAPEDDHQEITKLPFPAKEQVIVFSASPLVHCHY